MGSHLFFDQLALIALVWLFVMLLYAWPIERVQRPTPAAPRVPHCKHATEPKPVAGLTTTPYGALCDKESAVLNASPPRSYWIPGAYAPPLSEKWNSFLKPKKKKGFPKKIVTKVGVYDLGKFTTLESNKSLRDKVRSATWRRSTVLLSGRCRKTSSGTRSSGSDSSRYGEPSCGHSRW
jgi:hypothetical protein